MSGDTVLVTEVPKLPPRASDAHKGTFGKVLVVAGSVGMSGAAVLAGTAALRGGAGLVQVAVPESIQPVVAAGQPCYMTAALPADGQGRAGDAAAAVVLPLAESASSLVVGPGLGATRGVGELVRDLLSSSRLPIVADADALNVLAGRLDWLNGRAGPRVLTPHPGEFARLAGTDTTAVQSRRQELAAAFAKKHGVVLVLKGAGTVVTDGAKVYVNTTGNPGMATGGSGDVLSGLLGALLASAALPAFEAAVVGVYLHGLAGDLARERRGEAALIATDILEHLPDAFVKHHGS